MDTTVARIYGQVYQELRKSGRALSQVDMMLAAISCRMDIIVLTSDGDFKAIQDLRVENWLS